MFHSMALDEADQNRCLHGPYILNRKKIINKEIVSVIEGDGMICSKIK